MSKRLIGAVMCGGKSSRMGMDKAFIDYHGMPQWRYLHMQLSKLCDKVVISCRPEQSLSFDQSLTIVADKLTDIGPMAGVWTLLEMHPDCDILVIGCDYPLLEISDLITLTTRALPHFDAICFVNPDTMIAEPLIAVYQPNSKQYIKQAIAFKNYSLLKILKMINTEFVIPDKPERLRSFDTPSQIVDFNNLSANRHG